MNVYKLNSLQWSLGLLGIILIFVYHLKCPYNVGLMSIIAQNGQYKSGVKQDETEECGPHFIIHWCRKSVRGKRQCVI